MATGDCRRGGPAPSKGSAAHPPLDGAALPVQASQAQQGSRIGQQVWGEASVFHHEEHVNQLFEGALGRPSWGEGLEKAGPPLETALYSQQVRQEKARWPGHPRAVPGHSASVQGHRGGVGGGGWGPEGPCCVSIACTRVTSVSLDLQRTCSASAGFPLSPRPPAPGSACPRPESLPVRALWLSIPDSADAWHAACPSPRVPKQWLTPLPPQGLAALPRKATLRPLPPTGPREARPDDPARAAFLAVTSHTWSLCGSSAL